MKSYLFVGLGFYYLFLSYQIRNPVPQWDFYSYRGTKVLNKKAILFWGYYYYFIILKMYYHDHVVKSKLIKSVGPWWWRVKFNVSTFKLFSNTNWRDFCFIISLIRSLSLQLSLCVCVLLCYFSFIKYLVFVKFILSTRIQRRMQSYKSIFIYLEWFVYTSDAHVNG